MNIIQQYKKLLIDEMKVSKLSSQETKIIFDAYESAVIDLSLDALENVTQLTDLLGLPKEFINLFVNESVIFEEEKLEINDLMADQIEKWRKTRHKFIINYPQLMFVLLITMPILDNFIFLLGYVTNWGLYRYPVSNSIILPILFELVRGLSGISPTSRRFTVVIRYFYRVFLLLTFVIVSAMDGQSFGLFIISFILVNELLIFVNDSIAIPLRRDKPGESKREFEFLFLYISTIFLTFVIIDISLFAQFLIHSCLFSILIYNLKRNSKGLDISLFEEYRLVNKKLALVMADSTLSSNK